MSRVAFALAVALGCTLLSARTQAASTRPSDFVTVNASGATAGCGNGATTYYFDRQVRSDGSNGPVAPFTAPPGEVLIVTDVAVVAGGQAGDGTGAYLLIGDATTAVPVTADFETATGPDGLARLHFQFSTGLVVASGKSLCVRMYNAVIDQNSVLNGYLAKGR